MGTLFHKPFSLLLFVAAFLVSFAYGEVRLTVVKKQVILDNGLAKFTFTNPTGQLSQIEYAGIDKLLKPDYFEERRGYWDLNWQKNEADPGDSLTLLASKFDIIENTNARVEISFKKTWNPAENSIPMNFDIRYIVENGKPGVYAYAIFSRPSSMPSTILVGNRFTMRLNKERFSEMWQSDWKHRIMPNEDDFNSGKMLEYKEAAHVLQGPFKGEVADKYQYSLDTKDSDVYGWTSPQHNIGLWYIFPSHEFQNGGPTKQQLTIQSGPISLAVFSGSHLMKDNPSVFANGEAWEKIYGPFYIYLNRGPNAPALWMDAKSQVAKEKQRWPYEFVKCPTYVKRHQRAMVSGRFLVLEGTRALASKGAYIGLAAPGQPGSWQTESKYYQFWTNPDELGNFQIQNVVPGTYNLYAWVPGVLGNFMHAQTLRIRTGERIDLKTIVFNPPRTGPTLWEIGIADRTAAEFFVPNAPAIYTNPLYIKDEKWKQYGLWHTYSDIYPTEDLVYEVGVSDYTKHWFYAHLSRKEGDNTYVPATWTIVFNLKEVKADGKYTLRIGLAAENFARLQVRVNRLLMRAIFSERLSGRDNAIARHGIHGFYEILEVPIPSNLLLPGRNAIFLTQQIPGKFNGVMYDYLRLEGPL